jgi:SAM-dependent methyltransferase
MKDLTDQEYLLQRQYRDASNLRARIALHQRFSTNPQSLPRWFFERLEIPVGGRVLEVGCGPGGYWPEVAELIPDSWHITVSDFSPGMVTQARERLAALDRPFTVVQADVRDLPFPDQAFDAVTANFMLYHVPDRPCALAEIHRILGPDGRIFALTNGERHVRELKILVNRVAPGALRTEELGFSLENGAAQLAPWFDHIQVSRYPDTLNVTEAEPLLAYIRSYVTAVSRDQERALREQIEAELAARSALHLGKDSGMFRGVKLSLPQ